MDASAGGGRTVAGAVASTAKPNLHPWQRLKRQLSFKLLELSFNSRVGSLEVLQNIAGKLLDKLPFFQKKLAAQGAEEKMWSVEGERMLRGHTCIVTGGNVGIGKAVAGQLAACGAHVIIACRSLDKGEEAARSIREEVKKGTTARVDVMHLDLASMASVRAFSHAFAKQGHTLDVLVNNAGVMAPPVRGLTVDGFESQWQVNHLGHFLLTQQLLDSRQLSTKSGPIRVVNLSSMTHLAGNIHFDDINFDWVYNPFLAYSQSKLAIVLATKELHRRRSADGVVAVSVHPGLVDTHLARSFFLNLALPPFRPIVNSLLPLILISKHQALENVMYAIAGPAQEVAGKYVAYGKVGGNSRRSDDVLLAQRLWDLSLRQVGLPESSKDL